MSQLIIRLPLTDTITPDTLHTALSKYASAYIFMKEIGTNNSNPHVHGYIFLNPDSTIRKVRNTLTRKFPTITGNYQLKADKQPDKLPEYYNYICKGEEVTSTSMIQPPNRFLKHASHPDTYDNEWVNQHNTQYWETKNKINSKQLIKKSKQTLRQQLIQYIDSNYEIESIESEHEFIKVIVKAINEYIFTINNKNPSPATYKGIFQSVAYKYKPKLINKILYNQMQQFFF